MAYDMYGRPEDSGFEPHDATSSYMRFEPSSRQRYSPPNAAMSDHSESMSHDGVSPEVIAAITEKIKKEVFEHLKQTGTVEDPSKVPPLQRQPSHRSNPTTSPPTRHTDPVPMESKRSPPSSPVDKPSGVRFSDRGPPRPTGNRTYSTAELSAVDQKWGRLIDNEGRPTQRLGQFFRGLANHIIEEFPPKKTIVVTPSKMAAFYTQFDLPTEVHPLLSIFRAQANDHISHLYQDLGCQHHLVQEHSSMAPVVPALTPLGFAHWMTIHLLAYPEEESRRLEKVVLAMPVDADGAMIDGKPERLPKQISRYLLPEHEDRKSKKLLDGAIKDFLEDLGTTHRRKPSLTSPPLSRQPSTSNSRRNSQSRRQPVEIHQAKVSPTTAKPNPIERERKPYAGAPSSDASSNDEAIKIERDRQPYTSQPGNGRLYDNLNVPNRPARANSTSRTTEPNVSESRHARTHSNASRDSYTPRARRPSSPPLKSFSHSTPVNIDDTGSKYAPPPPASSASFTSSQPPTSTFSPGSYSSSSSAFPPPPPVDIRDKRPRDQYGRPRAEDEPRMTGEFNSPRDAERWDRYQESRGDNFDRPYQRGSVSIDPREGMSRGAPTEEWYRENARGPGYDDFRRYA